MGLTENGLSQVGRPMAHAPTVAHCTITSGALYPIENARKNMPARKKIIADL